MSHIRLPRLLSLLISFSLLVGPLPLSAMAHDLAVSLSEWEVGIVDSNPKASYVYLGADLSNIAELLLQISEFDDKINSPLQELKKHIECGFLIAEHDAVLEVLEYAQSIVKRNLSQEKIGVHLDKMIQQVTSGALVVDAMNRASHLRTLVINENMDVLGESTFHKHIKTKQGIHTLGKLKVDKAAKFKKNVTIDGTLSVTDLAVASCMDNLYVNTLSVVDATIDNLTFGGTLSVADLALQNLSVTNLTVLSCVDYVCVNTLSVINGTVTGTLSVDNQVINNVLIFQDPGPGYVGIQSPLTVPTSYTLSLPATVPTANQIIRANAITPTNLEWATETGGNSVPPAASKTIYVTKYGNDITGDGSFTSPYASLAQAISLANTLATSLNPISIKMSTGIYVENNSTGPLTVTTDGVSIVGDSPSGVVVVPGVPTNDLLLVNNSIQIFSMTFESFTPLATGITLAAGNLTILNDVRIINFLVGADCTGGAATSYGFTNCFFVSNGTALNVNNAYVECNSITIFGTSSLSGPPANQGIRATGSATNIALNSGVLGVCVTGIDITNNALMSVSGVSFRLNTFDIVQSGASHLALSACTFELTTGPSDADLQISGAGTMAEIVSCEFSGSGLFGSPEGTSLVVTNNAIVNISGGITHNYATGIEIGAVGDSSSTNLSASGLVIENCSTDILQQGSSTLNFNAGTAASSKIVINNAANVTLAFFDLDSNNSLSIGSTADINTALIKAAITSGSTPQIDYKSSLYSTQAIGFNNPLSNPSSWYVASPDDAHFTAITTDRTDIAGLRLVSDTGSPVGGVTALRGWDINKNASTAELSFSYQNSDTSGQSAVPEYTVMQLDGFNNQLQLPTAGTHIVFDGDTNLYRSAANVLKTDDNFIVGTLTPNKAVTTDPVTNELISSATTNTELGYVSGVTSPIQTQLNNKVSRSGDSMTGALTMLTQNAVHLQDAVGINYVGLNAQNTVPTSYTLSLPTTIPTANQIMRANSITPTNLEWVTAGGSVPPTNSKTIYVSKFGNDSTGDGSFATPYASLAKAINVANSLATALNPIAIVMSAGIYTENNSAGPLTITATGISITGSSANSTLIMPSTPANNLLLINNTVRVSDIGLQSTSPLATGISLSAGTFSVFSNLRVANFLVGVSCSGGSTSVYGFNNCLFALNGTALNINNCFVECNNCNVLGATSIVGPVANTGISITGSNARFLMNGGLCGELITGFIINGNAIANISGVTFRFNTFDIVQSGASNTTLSACSFEFTNTSSDIEIQVTGAGTTATIIGCEFNGNSNGGISQSSCIEVSANAVVNIASGNIHNYTTALQVGLSSDTASTQLAASGLTIHNCTNDIIQEGTATVNFNASTAISNNIIINDPTNVNLAFFDFNSDYALTIGSTANVDTTLMQAAITSTINPEINYKSSLYSTQAIGYTNPLFSPASLFMVSQDNANLTAVTTDRTDIAGVRLVSDTGSPVGGVTALRGWDINKNSTTAELSFAYQNSDSSGQSIVPEYTVMQLDGFNNQLQLPTVGTQIVFDGDTNLYRNAANVLKTDDNFIVGTLTPNRVVTTDPVTNELSSSVTTDTELSYLSGTTSSVQTQLNNKVSKTGDSMSGTLNMLAQNQIDFHDGATGFVGINAPSVVSSSYTLALPSTVPTINQTLRAGAVTPTHLAWVTEGGAIIPAVSETIYVTQYGNDITGNGSFDSPYATLAQAITIANSLASTSNPVAILIGPGIYIENNSAGPLAITADGIAIIGDSANTTSIIPTTLSNDLLLINNTINVTNLTFLAEGLSTATALSLTAGNLSTFNNLEIINFQIGASCSGAATNIYLFNNCLFVSNGTALSITSSAECNNCTIFGSESIASNTGVSITGAGSFFVMSGGSCALCITAINVGNNTSTTINAATFKFNTTDIAQTGASNMILSSCNFTVTNNPTDINIQISGAGTSADIIGCDFNGASITNIPQATALQVSNNASANMSSSIIENYTTGITIGLPGDTSSTVLSASNVTITNCTTDILQQGSSTLNCTASSVEVNKISINNSTNVTLAVFDLNDSNTLTIGSLSDEDTSLVQAAISNSAHPQIDYKSSLYSTQAIGFNNPLANPSSLFIVSQDNANLTAVTTDRTDTAGIRLVSDTGSPVGGTSALRGWDINKNGSAAQLSFAYQNSDIVGQVTVPEYTVMQLDGFNNLLQLPTAGTKIVFDGDTNLYRSTANVLKTDNNFIVGTLTPDRAVVTAPVTNQLASSSVTGTELGYLSGTTSSVQIQLNGKVAKTGDTMTGALQLPAGTTAAPSLVFTGSPTTGLSTNTGALSLSTNALERMKIASGGTISIDAFTTAGVVHNDASGNLSSSLIVNSDVAAGAGIVDSKLATISTAGKVANSATSATSSNTANTIVARDSSGNFAAGTITANLSGNATTATMATNFSGSLLGDVTGTQSATVVSSVGGQTATNVAAATVLANAATNLNSANTIVKRDASGNFNAGTITASLTGSASNNVLKTGDSMSGTLTMLAQNAINFDDSATGFVGLHAPSVVPSSYTLALPSTIPTAHQIIRANATTPTNLEWITDGGSVPPVDSKIIYVTQYGNDITGDGSFVSPYATISKAINVANALATVNNPICIFINPGIYIEDNSAGPLAITADGISVIGYSAESVYVICSTPTNDFLVVSGTVHISNLAIESFAPLATGLTATAGNLSIFENVRFANFATGVICSGGPAQLYTFNSCVFVANGIGLNVNDTRVESVGSSFFGTFSVGATPANTGVSATGAETTLVIDGGAVGNCNIGFDITTNASVTISATAFKLTIYDIIQNNASQLTLTGCSFELTTGSSDIEIQVSGAGTTADIASCQFYGSNLAGMPDGTGLIVTDDAFVNLNGGSMSNYINAISIGASTDTAATSLLASSFIVINCTSDIVQQGSASLNLNASTISSSKITINDPTNINLAFFDLDDNNALTIGSTGDVDTTLLQAAITPTNHPSINYQASLYGTQGIGYNNPYGPASSWYVASLDNTNLTAITTDRTDTAGVRLVSDTAVPFGGTSALRGWDIQKNGSAAQLAFNYQNSDIVGQSAVSEYTVMQLDGFNNLLQLPTAGTKIVFDSDTNLYRSAANILKTDSNLIVGTLTPDRVVVTAPVTNELASSAVTGTELSYLSGTTSSVQTQLNGKVAKAGDTMTGTLQLPAGSAATPSLVFTGSTTTGLSALSANTLSFDTNGIERMKIDGSGNVTIDGFSTAGVVHNSAAGLLSTSLIVDADITAATITNDKLANISSSNVSGDIVVRDGSSNFATNMITLFGTTTLATDAATKAYVDSAISLGLVAKTPAIVVSTTNIGSPPTGLLTIDGVTLVANNRVLLVGQTNPVQNGLWLAAAGAWTRPADFATGTEAGQAYVLILSGTVNAGSSWLCNTPMAVIDTDPIMFAEFSLPSSTTGANVGAGTGLVYQSKTGITLNFRTLLAGSHLTITNNANDITFTNDATSADTPSTMVARDSSGNFAASTITANLTGSASNNVLKAGDTMTGSLIMPAGTIAAPSIQFTGSSTGTGISAPMADLLSFDTNGVEQLNISSSGVTIDGLTPTAGIVHNSSAGLLSSSLIINADVSTSAAIVDTKLATISTAGKVTNSATTATSLDTANAIVARDASGNFSASTIVASLTGSASNNVLKAGDTMTGALQLPAGTTALPSLIFTGSTTSGLSANTGNLSFSTNGVEQLKISSSGTISVDAFALAGIVHNDSSGNLSSSLIVNNDISNSAAITDSKLNTISTAGKVANSATTATNANTASTIVSRDPSGNFSAGTITASLSGNATTATTATNFSGPLLGDVTGTQSATVVSTVGGQTAANVAAATVLANAATNANTPSTIVYRDASGNFAAGTITASLSGNATTATTATNFSGSLLGDVTGTQGATVVSTVGGQTAANVAAGAVLANAATNLDNANAIVKRDASGNFSAGTITASLSGNATTATAATNFSGSLLGDVTGTQSATVVSTVGGQTAANVAAGTVLANAATSADTVSTIVKRDSSGNFSATTITANLSGNATTANTATNFSGSLLGDVTGTQGATVVSTVGGQTAANVAAGTVLANAATNLDTANAIVKRDASGNFSASTIIANLTGSASNNVLKAGDTMTGALQLPAGTTALPSLVFTGSTTSGLSASAGNLSFSTSGVEQMKISSGGTISVDAFTSAGVVHNDSSGNLSSSLIVNSDIAAGAGIVDSKLATISTAGKVANSATTATNANSANAIVSRDASGNFSAGTITASLTGSASNNVLKAGDTMTGTLTHPAGSAAVPSIQFTGSTNTGLSASAANTLSFDANGVEQMNISSSGVTVDGLSTTGVVHNSSAGLLSTSLIVNADVDPAAAITDSKLATISTAGKVANSATTATSANTASTIVLRDASNNFSAGTITASLTGSASLDVLKSGDTMTGALQLPAGTTALPSLVFTGSTTSGLSATAGNLSFSTSGVEQMKISSGGTISVDAFTTAGVVHNDTSGNLSSSLIVNGDISATAGIVDSKLATISTAGKVANSATTATNTNTANAIVARDASGNFSAGTITANLTGNVTGNVTGSASLNVLKAGDTMTGTLIMPAGSAAAPSIKFTGSSTGTGISAPTADIISFDTNGVERINISSSGVTIDGLSTVGVVHNSAAGLLSTSLIVNADVDPAAAIVDSKLATISTAGKVANSATTATSANTASTIVLRDASNNFSAGTITASLTGSASLDVLKSGDTMTGALQLPAGTTALPSLVFTGSTTSGLSATAGNLSFSTSGVEQMKISSGGTISVDAFTSAGVVHNDSSGNLSSSLIVNADVSASAAIVDTKLNTISTAGKVANSATTATSTNTASSIVARDVSGNFSAGTITASLSGNATTATTATNFSGSLTGDVTGTQGATVVSTVGGQTAANVAAGAVLANAATNLNTASAIVKRDASGNFSAGTITASLSGNATTATTATNFSGSLTGDVTGTQGATVVSTVGGQTAANVAAGAVLANAATNLNTASAIVKRDASGNFSAGTITASLSGNATTATTATNFSGSLTGDVTGTQGATVVSTVGGQTAANVAAGAVLANAATNLNTASAIVKRDASGNFSAGTITASLTGSASNNVLKAGDTMTGTLIMPAGTAAAPSIKFTGSTNTGLSAATANTLSFDANGVEQMNISTSGVTIDGLSTAGVVHNSAAGLLSTSLIVNADITPATITNASLAAISSANVANDIVVRDASGNFSAGTITASLTGNATTATTATNFSGSLTGDVTGTQSATVVSTVGGQTAANVAAGAVLANAATNLNTASAIVKRDGTGSFAAQVISMTDGVHSGNLILSTEPSTSTAGNILKGSNRFIHDFGTNNTFMGINAGNFTTSGSGGNSAFGSSALTANGTGAFNTAVGSSALAANTIGIHNTALGYNALAVSTTGTDNTAIGYNALAANATGTSGNTAVGSGSLAANTTGTNNAAVGYNALTVNTIGINNTAVGSQTLSANTTGLNNTAVGVGALLSNTIGTDNTAVGHAALEFNTTGINNTAVGNQALQNNTIGSNNTAFGQQALASNTTGTRNTALGYFTLGNNVTGTDNTAIGYNALTVSQAGTSFNTAVGSNALAVSTVGVNNTAVGYNALASSTTGTDNTAIGYNALAINQTGTSFNTAVGSSALAANTTGTNNAAIGYQALKANTVGTHNTALGYDALVANTTGTDNTAIGYNTLSGCTTGTGNIAIGSGTGVALTTGSNNTYINSNDGAAGETLTIRIGSQATNTSTACFIQGIANATIATGQSTAVRVGNTTGQLAVAASSRRFKHDINDMDDTSANIYKLRPVNFVYNSDETDEKQYGLIAEEVAEVLPEIVSRDRDGLPFAVNYDVLPVLLVKEMQKQQVTIEELKKDNAQRDAIIKHLIARLNALEARS